MSERRVGLIPSVDLLCAEGRVDGAVLVTDRRIVVVPERAPGRRIKEAFREMFFGSEGPKGPDVIDFQSAPVDSIAGLAGSVSINLSSVRKVQFTCLLGTYDFATEYSDDEGKDHATVVQLTPPAELVKANKAQGVTAKETKRRYALRCQELVKRVLPPMAGSESRWLE